MPFDVDLHCNTFKFRFWAVYTQAYGGTGAIAPEYAAAKRGHHRFFFVGPRKRGVRPHPPNPPWLRACPDRSLGVERSMSSTWSFSAGDGASLSTSNGALGYVANLSILRLHFGCLDHWKTDGTSSEVVRFRCGKCAPHTRASLLADKARLAFRMRTFQSINSALLRTLRVSSATLKLGKEWNGSFEQTSASPLQPTRSARLPHKRYCVTCPFSSKRYPFLQVFPERFVQWGTTQWCGITYSKNRQKEQERNVGETDDLPRSSAADYM